MPTRMDFRRHCLSSTATILTIVFSLSACGQAEPKATAPRSGAHQGQVGSSVEPTGDGFYGFLDAQAFLVKKDSDKTASTTFTPIPGLSNLELCRPRGALGASLSASLDGAARLRVVMTNEATGNRKILHPGRVSFAGVQGSESFTFLKPRIRKPTIFLFSAEWASANGNTVTITKGSLHLTYQIDRKAGCA